MHNIGYKILTLMTYDGSSAGNYPVLLEYKIYVLGIIESSRVEHERLEFELDRAANFENSAY